MWRSHRRDPTALLTPADEVDEATLVGVAKLDRRAIEPLYRLYVGPIYGYCAHRLGSTALAEDATQQVFAQAIARRGSRPVQRRRPRRQ